SKPTKFEMETIRVKWSFLCRPEPTVVMNTCGYGSIRLNRNTVHPPLICPCFHQSYFTQFTRMHKIDSIFKMLLAPLPLAHLHNAIVLQCCSNHGFAFADGVTDRFFYIYVFASFHCIYHLQTMPVVRCSDDNRIDDVSFKQFFIIYKTFHLYLPFFQLRDSLI